MSTMSPAVSALFFAVILALAAPATAATAAVPADSPQDAGSISCRCCSECQAARKRSGTASEAGVKPVTDGCGKCCDKCGLKPEPTPTPPEKVEEKVRTKQSGKE